MLNWMIAIGMFGAVFLTSAAAQDSISARACRNIIANYQLTTSVEACTLQHVMTRGLKEDDSRRELATSISQYCASLQLRVPRNMPNEDKRVEEEWLAALTDLTGDSNANDARLNRVENSIEYASWTMHLLIAGCLHQANEIIYMTSLSPAKQTVAWLRLSNIFHDPHVIVLSGKLGLLSGDYRTITSVAPPYTRKGRDDSLITEFWPELGKIIQEIAIPLLDAAKE
jgi:hypothetical protein